ncbi:hypothetical protein D3C80_901540 [compost metagenome]
MIGDGRSRGPDRRADRAVGDDRHASGQNLVRRDVQQLELQRTDLQPVGWRFRDRKLSDVAFAGRGGIVAPSEGAIDQAAQPLGGDHFIVRPPAQSAGVELLNDQIGRDGLAKGRQTRRLGEKGRPGLSSHSFPAHQQRRQEGGGFGTDQQLLPDTNKARRRQSALAQITSDQDQQGVAAQGQPADAREEGVVIGFVLFKGDRRGSLDQTCLGPEQIDDDGGALADGLRQIAHRQPAQADIGDQGHSGGDNTVGLYGAG